MVLSEVELAVTCRLAKEETWNYGIIRGILPPRNEDDRTRRVNNMKEKLAIKGTQVREIIWIKKKIYNEERSSYEVKETNSVRLDFINDIPDKVFIGIMSYSVEPYTSEVTQCFKCQSFGHVSKHCKGPMKCVNCGRIGHKKTDCRASRPRCANCSMGQIWTMEILKKEVLKLCFWHISIKISKKKIVFFPLLFLTCQ